MSKNVMKNPAEKLDRVYVCSTCGMSFLFRSDMEDHSGLEGHRRMYEVTLE
jgi:hypothetical protein